MFAFDLCEKLKFPHPDYLLSLLTWDQFSDWVEYYRQKEHGYNPDTLTEPIDLAASLALLNRMKQHAAKESTAV